MPVAPHAVSYLSIVCIYNNDLNMKLIDELYN